MLNIKFYLLIVFSVMVLNISFGQQNKSKVILKNGDVLSGVIISQNQFNLLLRTQNGDIEIKTESIKSISYTENDIGEKDDSYKELMLLKLQQKSLPISAGLSFLLPGLGQYYIGNSNDNWSKNNYLRGAFYSASYITGVVLILIGGDLVLGGLIVCPTSVVISALDAAYSAKVYNEQLINIKD